jgi:hypothetical protein
MKRTILVLALTLLLSGVAPARASLDNGDVAIPGPTRSLSSADQGNTVNTPGTLLNNFSGVIPYLVALLY